MLLLFYSVPTSFSKVVLRLDFIREQSCCSGSSKDPFFSPLGSGSDPLFKIDEKLPFNCSVAEPEPPIFDPVGAEAGAAKKAPVPAPIIPQNLKTVGNRFFNFR